MQEDYLCLHIGSHCCLPYSRLHKISVGYRRHVLVIACIFVSRYVVFQSDRLKSFYIK